MFSGNYLSLLALSLTVFFLWKGQSSDIKRHFSGWRIVVLSVVIVSWGLIEMKVITQYIRQRNIDRDRFVPVAERLTQLAREHSKSPSDREVVFSTDVIVVSENVSSLAPQAPFMSMSLPFAAGLSTREWHERFFQYLYYSGVTPTQLAHALEANEMVSTMSTFGYDRYNPNLTDKFIPVTGAEIQQKVNEYSSFVERFEAGSSSYPAISYLVVRASTLIDFSNFDRWYIRDGGEVIGPFTLYQVRPRTSVAP
jgi:hypothetical protein